MVEWMFSELGNFLQVNAAKVLTQPNVGYGKNEKHPLCKSVQEFTRQTTQYSPSHCISFQLSMPNTLT